MDIEQKLREAGLKFEKVPMPGTIADGGIRGLVALGDSGRTHWFIVSTNPDEYYGMSDYDVLCPIKIGISPEDALNAAQMAATMRRGAIVADAHTLYLRMDLPADLSGPAMVDQIGGLCSIADDIEQALFGADEL